MNNYEGQVTNKQICKVTDADEVLAHISLQNKLEVMLKGRSFLFWVKKTGWRGNLPIYLFFCPDHGYVTSHLIGEYEKLVCPYCDYTLEC